MKYTKDNLKMSSVDEKTKSYDDYMKRVGKETIPVYEPSVGNEELENLKDVIESNWLSEGKYAREFEERLAEMHDRKYGLCFSNATAAMIVGMKSLGIKEGDEVIVPSFAHSADVNVISVAGGTPTFADVEKETLCLSVRTIQDAMTEKTKAVLYIALYGNTGNLEEIEKFCKDNNLILINDCAPALGGTYKGKAIASYGDFGVLSFFADKTITTGEGGMLLTDNPDLIEECNIYKHDGRRERGHDLIERKGYNFRITEMQAAVGVAQLDKVQSFIDRKKEIYEIYKTELDHLDKVEVFEFNPEGDIVPHRVVIFVPDWKPLERWLNSLGIGVRNLFMPMHNMPCYGCDKDFVVTEELFERGLQIPSAPTLTDKDVYFVCDSIKKFYEEGNDE